MDEASFHLQAPSSGSWPNFTTHRKKRNEKQVGAGFKPAPTLIPAPNEHLDGLTQVIAGVVDRVVKFVSKRREQDHATLDADATLINTHKKNALYCYKGYKAYQPFNFFWAELCLVLYTQFRDGNVPAGYGQLEALKEALSLLPYSVKKVLFRADSASYNHDLLTYMARGKDPRFGVIEFAVSADLSSSLRQSITQIPEWKWTAYQKHNGKKWVPTNQEWAVADFVPSAICDTKKDEGYKYIVIREKLKQQPLPGIDPKQLNLPFQVARLGDQKKLYKLSAIVTNRHLPEEEIISWHRQRCGHDEHSHSELKSALGGGQLPSGDFGENAAWWGCAVLAYNLNQALKLLAMPAKWIGSRIKAIRLHLINLPGRVIKRSRQLMIRLTAGHPSNQLLRSICHAINALYEEPLVI